MKKTFLSVLLSALCLLAAAQDKFDIAHGPYLQEVTQDGATIVFLTSANAVSRVEVKPHGAADAQAVSHHTSRDGLKAANTTFHSVRVENLAPDSQYDYRILSKEIRDLQPYHADFGDSITTRWYTFSTANPKKKGASIFITSDIHSNADKLETLLNRLDYKTCDAIFYAGDMMNYFNEAEAPFKSFIDKSVEMFASTRPFVVVRGNHETRGAYARSFSGYFPKKDGKIYGSYLMGDVMIVMLDSGEDKKDSHWAYSGLTDYDAYRSEQARWLEQLVKTKEYRKARYRIVICHFPMVMTQDQKDEGEWLGWQDAIDKFLPILNRADVDLMVSGHTHRYLYHEPDTDGIRFPVLEQGNNSAARLELHDGKIGMKVIDTQGKVLKQATL